MALWAPTDDTTAKLLWLDPKDVSTVDETGGSLNQLDDKSGNGYHASPSGTVTISGGTVTIGGSASDYLRSNHAGVSESDWTYFMVFQPLSESTWGRYLSWVIGTDYTTGNRALLYRASTSTDVRVGTRDGGGGTITTFGGISTNVTAPYLICAQGSGDSIEAFRNGASFGTSTWTNFAYENPATIFGQGDASTGLLLCEYIAIKGVLDQATREKYEGYLMWGCGIESHNYLAGHHL